ncbi:MAG: hypothetical protein LBR15_01245 [Methanobrevibacter sp.]|nr:hypothetical protein [Candidatus Methanovirga australis]
MSKFKILCSMFVIFVLFLSIYSRSVVAGEVINGMNERHDPLVNKGVRNMHGSNLILDSNKNSTIIYVDNTTEENHYKDLKTAISKSKAGDIICVEPGFYKSEGNSNITIDHDLTILGNNTYKIGIDVNNTKNKRYTNNTYFGSDVVFDGEGKNNFLTIDKGVNLTLLNLTFINGVSKSSGGVITNNGILTIHSSSFSNNSVTQTIDDDDWWDKPHDSTDDLKNLSDSYKSFGGTIYSTNQLTITDSNFDGNIAGEYCKGGAIFNDGEKLDINNTLFKSNIGFDGGGAIYNTNGSLSIDYSTFELNTASTDTSSSGGGAIYAKNTNIKIDDSIFMLNVAYRSYGGAINNKDSSLTSNNNYFIGNVADGGDGGAIYSLRNYETFINGSLFTLNNASADGGAIYHKASKSFNLENSVFVNDTANRGGATYFGDSEKINSINSAFINNSCNSEGGSLYNDNSNVHIISNEFSGSNSKKGGAIYSNDGGLNVKDSILRDNHAMVDGGSLYSSTDRMNIKNNYLINNTAVNNGGGFYLTGDHNSVDNSTFAVNIAINGGAIYNTGSDLNTHGSVFEANYAVEDGGVIWSGKNLQLKQNSYEKNMAGKYGAVLFSKEDKPDESLSKFSDDFAGYGGDHYYTQKQKDEAPGIMIGVLIANILVIIGLTVAAVISGGALAELPVAYGAVVAGSWSAVGLSIAINIGMGLVGMGLIMLCEYLFELAPEYKKFNERNPLLLPLITLAIAIVCCILAIKDVFRSAITFFANLLGPAGFVPGAGGAALNGFIAIVQHLDDVVTLIIYGVKVGAGLSEHSGYEPPDFSEYQNNPVTNNSNQLFLKGLSFSYSGIQIDLTDYSVSVWNMTSYDVDSGVSDFIFQATPKIHGYPMLYCKGSYNTMNYYMTIDFFTSVVYDPSSRVYSWKGHYSDLVNGQ